MDVAAHEIYNDQRWKGFMPKGLPASEATDRLSLGFAKKLWRLKRRDSAARPSTSAAPLRRSTPVKEITLDRQTHDLPPGRYVLIGYKDAVFARLFYDLLKPIGNDTILFRGYTGVFPDGLRGWTALLLRRYPFAYMGIDDHELLFAGGKPPAEADVLGNWRLDALYYSNQPVPHRADSRSAGRGGALRIDCDTSGSSQGFVLPKFVAEHFQTETFATFRASSASVDREYMVGKWIDRSSRALRQVAAGQRAGVVSSRAGSKPRRGGSCCTICSRGSIR